MKQENKWVTKDGRILLIAEMSDRHIYNSINMLKRYLDKKPQRQFYSGDSEAAEVWVDMENLENDELEQRIIEKINALESELKNRSKI